MRSSGSMGSRSDDAAAVGPRERPSAGLVARLREGKAQLRRERERLPFPEKVRQVIELQKAVYPLIAQRRELEPWERPWEIEP
jgi:hypothetical protein